LMYNKNKVENMKIAKIVKKNKQQRKTEIFQKKSDDI